MERKRILPPIDYFRFTINNNLAQKPFNYGTVFLKLFLNTIKIKLKTSHEKKTFACNSIVQQYN